MTAIQVITIGSNFERGDCFKAYPLADIAENGVPKEPVSSPRMAWIFCADYQGPDLEEVLSEDIPRAYTIDLNGLDLSDGYVNLDWQSLSPRISRKA